MKKLIYIILSIVILSGCVSSKKHLQRGHYDLAVKKAVKKIRKKPTSKKDIFVLEKAYPLANERDNERIKYLRLEGKPDIWDEVFRLYSQLKKRQSLVKTVCPIKLPDRTISFKYVDYDEEIIEAKKRAAEYFYAHSQKLFKNNDKESYRQAYFELKKVKQYYSDYKDVDALIKEAKYKGTSRVLITVKTPANLPKEFEENLLSFGTNNLNREWVEYYTKSKKNNNFYDYSIVINIKIIDVSPERIKEKHYSQSKEIEDGWEYVLDNKGNVMKDSLGNDIKVPKKVTIICNVIENLQQKAVHIEGSVDYMKYNSNQLLKTEKITADNFFEYVSAMAIGDIRALNPETKEIIGRPPVPFPPDIDMIFQAGEIIKKVAMDVLRDNRRFLK